MSGPGAAVTADEGEVVVDASVISRLRAEVDDLTRVDVFALDADDDEDACYIRVELVDQGNSTAAFTLYEGRQALVRTEGY